MPTRYVDEMLEPASPHHRASSASIFYSIGTFSSPLYIGGHYPVPTFAHPFPTHPYSVLLTHATDKACFLIGCGA